MPPLGVKVLDQAATARAGRSRRR